MWSSRFCNHDVETAIIDLGMMPSNHISIFDPSRIHSTKPDYLLVLPWNHSENIIEKTQYIHK